VQFGSVNKQVQTSPAAAALIRLLRQWPRKVIAAQLLDQESPSDFLLSGALERTLTSLTPSRIVATRRSPAPRDRSLILCDEHSVRAISILDPVYPSILRAIPDPPLVLYAYGSTDLLDRPSVAVVGSRQCTQSGRAIARRIAADLAQLDLPVVSGLALGIDGAAHEGALTAQGGHGSTIGVLGGGLGRFYPRQHFSLASRIISTGGLLVTEYPFFAAPLARRFPERNRLISGLSLATVVVEATPRSGSLITARFALEQGRDVFAVPGPPTGITSAGCHELIQQGAGLVCNAREIVRAISLDMGRDERSPLAQQITPSFSLKAVQSSLSSDAVCAFEHLSGYPKSFDELLLDVPFDAVKLSSALTELELSGFVQNGPVGYSLAP